MGQRQTARVIFYDEASGTDYEDEYLRHKTINTYFFKDIVTGEKYRWSTSKKADLYIDREYTITFTPTEIVRYGKKILRVKVN